MRIHLLGPAPSDEEVTAAIAEVEALVKGMGSPGELPQPGKQRTVSALATLTRASLMRDMSAVNMTARTIDLRDEFPRDISEQPASSNLQRIAQSPKLKTMRALAPKVEAGATLTEDEEQSLYETYSDAVDLVEDLLDMCQRRETALREAGVVFGRPTRDPDV